MEAMFSAICTKTGKSANAVEIQDVLHAVTTIVADRAIATNGVQILRRIIRLLFGSKTSGSARATNRAVCISKRPPKAGCSIAENQHVQNSRRPAPSKI